MEGPELAARFSYITNSLRYCGPEEASKQFMERMRGKKNDDEIRKSIMRFEGLYPYLSAIAENSGRDFLDYGVVEAYWIGNSLLDSFGDGKLDGIIDKLSMRGLPKSIASDLKKRMPKGLCPHHNFNVYFVGVGRTAGTVETNLHNMNNCHIISGKVVDVQPKTLTVMTRRLLWKNKELVYGDEEPMTALYFKEMMPDVKPGDFVALHWGFACLKLSDEQRKNLESYDDKILSILNKNHCIALQ